QEQPSTSATAQVERHADRAGETEEQSPAPGSRHHDGGQSHEAEPGQQRPPVAAVARVKPKEERRTDPEQQRPEDAADTYRDRQPVDEEQDPYAYEQGAEHGQSQTTLAFPCT